MPAYYNLHETYRMQTTIPHCDQDTSSYTYTVQLYKRRKSPHFKVLTMLHERTQSRTLALEPFFDRLSAQEYAQEQADKYGLGAYTDFTHFFTDGI